MQFPPRCFRTLTQDTPFEFLPSIVSLILEHTRRPENPRFTIVPTHSTASTPRMPNLEDTLGHGHVLVDPTLNVTFIYCRIDSQYIFFVITRYSMSKNQETSLVRGLKDLMGFFLFDANSLIDLSRSSRIEVAK
jgi:hypothetical protein